MDNEPIPPREQTIAQMKKLRDRVNAESVDVEQRILNLQARHKYLVSYGAALDIVIFNLEEIGK